MPSTADREFLLHDDPATVTSWCHERTTPGCILVAPSASSRRQFLHNAAAANGVSLGVDAVARGRLFSKLESRAGLTPLPTLSPVLERMLVADAAHEARVPLFDKTGFGTPPGATATVAGLFDSLRVNGITHNQFAEAGGDSRAADAYRRFEQKRATLGISDLTDQVSRLRAHGIPAVKLVIEEPAFANRTMFDFYSDAIRASTYCAIGMSDFSGDDAASSTIGRLESLGFTAPRVSSQQISPQIRALGGVGIHDEVNLVARHILVLLRRTPADSGTVMGVAPNGEYLSLLHNACASLGIPIASPRRIPVLEVPLVRALLDAFRAIALETEDTMERGLALLATPYLGLKVHAADQQRRHSLLRGRGSMRDWWRIAENVRRKKFTELAEAIPLLAKRLQHPRTPRELANVMTSLALDFGFVSAGRKAYLDVQDEDAVRLDSQGWAVMTDAIDELNAALQLCGVATVTASDWLRELTSALDAGTVRSGAKGTNGIHLTVAGAGLPAADHIFAVGWKEGIFPRRIREDAFLPDRVKLVLNEMGAMLPLAEHRAAVDLDKRERIRCAARQTLTISWPATDEDGNQQLPSFYIADLGVAKSEVVTRSVGDSTWPLDLTATRSESLTRATVLARHRPAAAISTEIAAVRSTLSELTQPESRAFTRALHAPQTVSFPQEIRAELGALAATMSASQSKTFVHCLYRHFGEKRLALASLAEPALDALMRGSIAHAVLAASGRRGFAADEVAQIFANAWTSTLEHADIRDDTTTEFERYLLFERLSAIIGAEREWLAADKCRAAHFELAFGNLDDSHDTERDPLSRAEGLSIDLPVGSRIPHSMVRGSIDRVDVVDIEGIRYGVAIDYKLGSGTNDRKEMDDLADFQFPIYCEVLPAFGIRPVGALYYGIANGERHGVIREDFADFLLPAEFEGKVTRLSAEEFDTYMHLRQQRLREEVARLARGEPVVKPRNDDCSWCGLRPVCRVGTFAVGGPGNGE